MRFRSLPKEFPEEYKDEELFSCMTWGDQRMLERYYGLGMDKQDPEQIAKDFYTSVYTVRKRLKIALLRLEKLPKNSE